MSIQPLPPEVVAQIKASTTITSLNGVIIELLKNSLDAGSNKIEIAVNYGRGSCTVEDNGLGILPNEYGVGGRLGKMYHSSRLSSPAPVHGKLGAFLASLSAMSLLMITSHHHQHRSHNTLSMHMSEVVSRQVPAPPQQHLASFDHGTRVSVRDLFGSMPVRMKQRAIIAERQGGSTKEWDLLRAGITIHLLAWPEPVSIVVRELGTSRKMVIKAPHATQQYGVVDITKVCSIMSQASFITPEEPSPWVPVKASTSALQILGAISLDPVATKHLQFLAFGIQPVVAMDGLNILHDEINRLFQNSSFGIENNTEELTAVEKQRRNKDGRYKGDGFTSKELKGRKGVDRWPMFYINIEFLNASSDICKLDIEDILDDTANSLGSVIELLQAMIIEFLTKNHFRSKNMRHQRQLHDTNEIKKNIETTLITNSAFQPVDTREARGSIIEIASKPKNAKIRKEKTSKSDPLGTNINLPSFRRSASTFETQFDAWSRTKSGNKTPRINVPKDSLSPASLPSASPLPVPAQIPETLAISLTPGPSASKCRKLSAPLFSSAGKMIRRPFDDDPMQPNRLEVQTLDTPVLKELGPNDSARDGGDDFMKWINPITKLESVVSKRTGLTVPKMQNSARSTASVSTRLSSHVKFPSTITSVQKPSPWITSILEKWDNPIFQPNEITIPRVSLEGTSFKFLHEHHHHCTPLEINIAFKDIFPGIVGRISKSALRDAEVISQVDNKFVLVKVQLNEQSGTQLVIIDQHAADERVRIEGLMEELCTPPLQEARSESSILTMQLERPLLFNVPTKEIDLLRSHKKHLAKWGILYDTPVEDSSVRDKQTCILVVRSLPPGIIERCKMDPRLVIKLLRTEAWRLQDKSPPYSSPTIPGTTSSKHLWLTKIHTCPQGIIDMLNSRACRSAIMFNDKLSNEQCRVLVKRLAECAFPFQCAHGRPSLVPLVELGSLRISTETDEWGEVFGKAFRMWKETRH